MFFIFKWLQSRVEFYFEGCEAGWTRYGDGCYKNIGDLNFIKGSDTCRNEFAEIYTPVTREEAYWVADAFG